MEVFDQTTKGREEEEEEEEGRFRTLPHSIGGSILTVYWPRGRKYIQRTLAIKEARAAREQSFNELKRRFSLGLSRACLGK